MAEPEDADEPPMDQEYAALAVNILRAIAEQGILPPVGGPLQQVLGAPPHGPPPVPPAFGQQLVVQGFRTKRAILDEIIAGGPHPRDLAPIGNYIIACCRTGVRVRTVPRPVAAYAARLFRACQEMYESIVAALGMCGLTELSAAELDERRQQIEQTMVRLNGMVVAAVDRGAPRTATFFPYWARDVEVLETMSDAEWRYQPLPAKATRVIDRWRVEMERLITATRSYMNANRPTPPPAPQAETLERLWPIGVVFGGTLTDEDVPDAEAADVRAAIEACLRRDCPALPDTGRAVSTHVFASQPWLQPGGVSIGATSAVAAYAKLDDLVRDQTAPYVLPHLGVGSLNGMFSQLKITTITQDATMQIAIANMLVSLELDPNATSTSLLPNRRTTSMTLALRAWASDPSSPLSSENIVSVARTLLTKSSTGKRSVLPPVRNKAENKGFGRRN